MSEVNTPRQHSKLVPVSAVLDRLGVRAPVTVYRLIARQGFPKPVKIGSRSVWAMAEVDAWLEAQMARRDRTG